MTRLINNFKKKNFKDAYVRWRIRRVVGVIIVVVVVVAEIDAVLAGYQPHELLLVLAFLTMTRRVLLTGTTLVFLRLDLVFVLIAGAQIDYIRFDTDDGLASDSRVDLLLAIAQQLARLKVSPLDASLEHGVVGELARQAQLELDDLERPLRLIALVQHERRLLAEQVLEMLGRSFDVRGRIGR